VLIPDHLRCEYLANPVGIDLRQPRLSWELRSQERDQRQIAYQILCAVKETDLARGESLLWDSGRVASNQSVHIHYAGKALTSGLRCWWKVRVWDQAEDPSPYSQPAFWQMGLLEPSDWKAEWIWLEVVANAQMPGIRPCSYFRRSFSVKEPVERATLYATAKGVYELRMNGERVGDAVLAPGWTDYHQRIQYQTYDVTDLLRSDENALGVILGDGWYSGHVGHKGGKAHYGDYPEFLAQLEVEHSDGSVTTLVSDATWLGTTGPILFSDLLMGETYDAQLEMPGWDTALYDDSEWRGVRAGVDRRPQLVASTAPPVRVTQELTPRALVQRSSGSYVFDMGQNMVGWVRLKAQGDVGTRISLRFAEVLNPDGSLHTDNLRSARATDTFIVGAAGTQIFEPHFTYHGFRYVEMMGFPGEPSLDTLVGCVIHSDLSASGSFQCSNPMINRLWQNVMWGQRGNFISVPTDCPQRDERLGWTGDAQLFARTACLNMDAAAFFTKWMADVQDGQSADGAFADVAPRLVVTAEGAPAWGDAGIIVPWTLYQIYGDREILARHYAAMSRWMVYIHSANPHLLRTKRLNNNYGDWVALDLRTSKELLATAYWALLARQMSQIANALNRVDESDLYRQLWAEIKQAFNTAYVFPDGRIEGGSQAAYVVALYADLLDGPQRIAAAGYLVEEIERRKWHLSTGFIGTAYLCQVLSDAGYTDVAYRLLNNESYPSWGYMIKHGATTVWERWNSYTAESGLHEPEMNSFNHYAFGSVGEWLYRYVGGIDTDPERPGFEHVLIRPRPGGGLDYARTQYRSIRGLIACDWQVSDRNLYVDVSIPANSTATVYIPGNSATRITEADNEPDAAQGVRYLRYEPGAHVFEVGSGEYHFVAVSDAVA
jgi:alpha-L-rhamnosidase